MTVHFDGSNSSAADGISSYKWIFSDGTQLVRPTPTIDHTFTTSGFQSVTLVVTDTRGGSSQKSATVRVNTVPLAAFSVALDQTQLPTVATLDASASSDDVPGLLYTWTLDDGSILVPATNNPVSTVALIGAGDYIVHLTVTDSEGLIAQASHPIRVNGWPQAAAIVTPLLGDFPMTVSFNALPSHDDDAIQSYLWELDGSTVISTEATGSFTIGMAGMHQLRLTVTDTDGQIDAEVFPISVFPNNAPVASFAINPSTVVAPALVAFDAISSTDDRAIVNYQWQFGTAGSAQSSSPRTTFTFNQPGDYDITLTVLDDQGAMTSTTRGVSIVANTPPVAALSANVTDGEAPLAVLLDASLSTDDEPNPMYDWDFGDGTTMTNGRAQEPHTYKTPGSYTASVSVRDRHNANSTAQIPLHAINPTSDDQTAPEILAAPESGDVPTTQDEVVIALRDDAGMDYKTLRVYLNNSLLDPSRFIVDEPNNLVRVQFGAAHPFPLGDKTSLGVKITDNSGNYSTKGFYYQGVVAIAPDTQGPVVNFIPEGGDLTTLTPTITIAAYDKAGTNFNSLNVLLNGNAIPSSYFQIDAANDRVVMVLDAAHALQDDFINIIQVTVQDQLGNISHAGVGFDTRDEKSSIVAVTGIDQLGLSLGNVHTCQITATRDVKCWGFGTSGYLGYGNTTTIGDNETPAAVGNVSLGAPVQELGVGQTHTCALLDTGDVRCWGASDQGQLGLGNTNTIGDNEVPSSQPVVSLGGPIAHLRVGAFHNCALRQDGALVCWGYNAFGQLGLGITGNIGDNELPSSAGVVTVGGASPIIDVQAGINHTCALNQAGQVKCWGRNTYRQLGQGNLGDVYGDNELPSTVAFLDLGESATAISVGGEHSCALLASKKVKCWGRNDSGQLGQGHTALITNTQTLPTISVGEDVAKIAAGGNDTCVVTVSGKARCWGLNTTGQLGLGNTLNVGDDEVPSSVAAIQLGGTVIAIKPGGNHTCGEMSNADLYCWGSGTLGKLGYGNTNTIGDNEQPLSAGTVSIMSLGSSGSLVARISANPYSGIIPLSVAFNGGASTSTVGTIVDYAWDFGDGTTTSGPSPTLSHVFTEAGVYLVTLTVTDSAQDTATVKAAVSVDNANIPPVASFTPNKDAGKIGESFAFDASASFDPKGEVGSYYWNFGDGHVLNTTDPNATHSFTGLGLYLVSLTVTGAQGRVSDEYFVPIYVNALNEAPVPRMDCTPGDYQISCSALYAVDFDGEIKVYEWDMGDDQILYGQDITHTYGKPGLGKFTPKLTVTDNAGLSASLTGTELIFDHDAPTLMTDLQNHLSLPTFRLPISITVADENNTVTDIWLNNQVAFTSVDKNISYTLLLAGGTNRVEIRSRDLAGNLADTLVFDDIKGVNAIPTIQLGSTGGGFTNDPSFMLDATIVDEGSTLTSIVLNDAVVFQDLTEKDIHRALPLREGQNHIEVITFDETKQTSKIALQDVTLDTHAPRLMAVNPAEGERFVGLPELTISVSVDEPLTHATIDGEEITLTGNGTQFSLVRPNPTEADYSVDITATDRAGNVTTVTRHFSILQHILHAAMVTLIPDSTGLRVVGQPGATRFPGQLVEIDGGFFNSTEVTSNPDGSFEGHIRGTSEVEISAQSSEYNFSESFRIAYNADTTLAGIVQNSRGEVLSGVTVRIVSTGQTALTDESGVFNLVQPATGDQQIVVDGTTIPEGSTGDERYSKITLNVSLGFRERNVLDRPVFLAPMLIDGTETEVPDNVDVVATSPHAPGVQLEIPAGSAQFPDGTAVDRDGTMTNVVTMAEIPADKAALPVPDQAKPDTVFALEPSGTSFTQPAKLTLPNTNNFPEGTRLVIMSKNSETGNWELDGSAEVASSGSIETLPGQGITHFSEVYAIPYGLEVTARENGEYPTIDSQGGALSTAVSLPSYKVMGQDVTPTLVYKSNWAQPNALVSNVFNLDRSYQIVRDQQTNRFTPATVGTGTVTTEVWTTPDSIKSQFSVDSLQGQEITFNVANAPKQAVITYAMDLDSLVSGQYFARANYEIKYKNLIITTVKTQIATGGVVWKTKTDKYVDTVYQKLFPEPLGQLIHNQNKKNSTAGAGWKLNLAQEILNPQNPRLLIEESSGATSSYVLNNTISTLVYDEGGIKNAELSDSSEITYVRDNGIVASSTPDGTPSDEFMIPSYSFDQAVRVAWKKHRSSQKCSSWSAFGTCSGHTYYTYDVGCQFNRYQLHPLKKTTAFRNLGGKYFYLDERGALFSHDGTESLVAGNLGRPALQTLQGTATYPNVAARCEQMFGDKCDASTRKDALSWVRKSNQNSSNFLPSFNYCGNIPVDTTPTPVGVSNYPFAGYASGTLTEAKFNAPLDFAESKSQGGVIYVADTGNHLVRKISIGGNSVEDFAGNRQILGDADSGDGAQALTANLYHPRGVTTDQAGNVYIATEHGLIRKVETTGIISTLAGKTRRPGPSESVSLSEVSLLNPTGLVFDEDNQILYVADTGNHRVVALDIPNNNAFQVAGNNLCQAGPEFIQDGSPALDVSICSPERIGLDDDKNLLILDTNNKRVRKVNLQFARNGTAIFAASAKDGSQIERDENGNFKRVYRDQSAAFFDQDGKQLSAQDRLGNTTSFTYDGDGNLTEVKDPKDGAITMTYSYGRMFSITDPAGRVTQLDHTDGKLTQVNLPDGTHKSFQYQSGSNLMIAESDQRNNMTTYEYGPWKRLKKVYRPDGTNVQIAEGILETIGNGFTGGTVGQVQSYGAGNTQGNAILDVYKNAKGIDTTLKKDLSGYVSAITDTKGLVTTIERDNMGRPTKITRHDGSYSSFTYNSMGDLIDKVDSANGTHETYAYNTLGLLTAYSTTVGFETKTLSNTYDVNGLLTRETDFNGKGLTRTYQPDGQLDTATNDLGETVQQAYDVRGNLYRKTAPKGEEVTLSRDYAGNIVQKIDGKGLTTNYEYDAFNRLVRVETGISNSRPVGDVTTYAYSESGQLALITDPQGNQTSFEYNSLDQLIKKTTSLGQITELAYDPNGNVNWEKDPNNNIKTYEYNAADELIRKIVPGNLYQMSYDDDGNIISIGDSDSSLEYSYTKVNGQFMVAGTTATGTDMPTIELEYEYNSFANRVGMTSPYGNTSYSYDAGNRMTGMTDHMGHNFSFGYDDANRLRVITRPGSSTQLDFDANGFLTNMLHKRGPTTVEQALYTSDANGNRIGMNTPRGNRAYNYDTNQQLITASNPEAPGDYQNETFSYDSLGNRLNDQLGSYAYDVKKQRLVQDATYFYSYDNNGNMVSRSERNFVGNTTNYTYSSENQLIQVEDFQNNVLVKTVTYRYDAIGRRIAKSIQTGSGTLERKYAYDGNEIIGEYNGSNTLLASYTQSGLRTDDTLAAHISAAGVTAGMATSAGSVYYLKDGLGSITDIVDGGGNVIQHYVYSSFGKLLKITNAAEQDVTSASPVKTSFTYTNREYDEETGFYYYRARYYSAEIGRFLAADPDSGRKSNPQTFNTKYAYVGNNPLKLTDPSGRSWGPRITLSQRDQQTLIKIAIIAAAAYTGGAAAEAFSSDAFSGAVIGAGTGGVVGGAGYEAFGVGSFKEGFTAGAIAGGITGYGVGSKIEESSAGSEIGRSPSGSDTFESDNAAIDEYRDTFDARDICLREGRAECLDIGPMGMDPWEFLPKGERMDTNYNIFQRNIDRLLLGL